MKSLVAILLFATCLFARADLPYKLPPKAKYTATSEAIARAMAELSAKLVTNAITLTNLFTSPMMLVAEGKDATIFCQFEKGRVFWADEVKRTHFKK